MPRAIAYMTYLKYAKKYNINTKKKNGEDKTMKELAKEIHSYEMKYILPVRKKKGLYVV